MIQRIQSIYLLLASAAAFSMLKFHIWQAKFKLVGVNALKFSILKEWPLLILTILIGCLIFYAIFLYKKRILQISIILLNILLTVLLLYGIYHYTTAGGDSGFATKLVNVNLGWGAAMPFLIIIFCFLTIRNILKDKKRTRSMDQLR